MRMTMRASTGAASAVPNPPKEVPAGAAGASANLTFVVRTCGNPKCKHPTKIMSPAKAEDFTYCRACDCRTDGLRKGGE